jgi:hypothetical protein
LTWSLLGHLPGQTLHVRFVDNKFIPASKTKPTDANDGVEVNICADIELDEVRGSSQNAGGQKFVHKYSEQG